MSGLSQIDEIDDCRTMKERRIAENRDGGLFDEIPLWRKWHIIYYEDNYSFLRETIFTNLKQKAFSSLIFYKWFVLNYEIYFKSKTINLKF